MVYCLVSCQFSHQFFQVLWKITSCNPLSTPPAALQSHKHQDKSIHFGGDKTYDLVRLQTFFLPISKQPWVTAACLMTSRKRLICGDPSGSVHLYDLGDVTVCDAGCCVACFVLLLVIVLYLYLVVFVFLCFSLCRFMQL